jgi:hypothetical protein
MTRLPPPTPTQASCIPFYCLILTKLVFLPNVLQLLLTSTVLSSLVPFALMMEDICSSEMSVIKTATRRHIAEDSILHSHRHENLKYYIALTGWTL